MLKLPYACIDNTFTALVAVGQSGLDVAGSVTRREEDRNYTVNGRTPKIGRYDRWYSLTCTSSRGGSSKSARLF